MTSRPRPVYKPIPGPYPAPTKQLKPSDWGMGMTVCIAALCDNGESIAVATDQMISTMVASGDVAMKAFFIHRFWMLMYAGNDLGRVMPVMEYSYASLRQPSVVEHTNKDGLVSAWFVEKTVCDVMQTEVVTEATRRVLGRYGLTMRQFLENGRAWFGDAGFQGLRREIENVLVDCEFLLVGFAENGQGRIYIVSPPGVAYRCGPMPFYAIGSGSHNAIGSLLLHEHKPSTPHVLGLYRVCEAKFMAESAIGVGRSTVVAVFRKDGKVGYISQRRIQWIRSQWEKKGKPRIPKGIEEVIGGAGVIRWDLGERGEAPPESAPSA